MALKVTVNDLHFTTSQEYPMIMFGANLVILAQICEELSRGQTEFPRITLTPYMVLPLFATRFAAYAGGIRVSFIQPRLFQFDIKCSAWEIYHIDLYGWNL